MHCLELMRFLTKIKLPFPGTQLLEPGPPMAPYMRTWMEFAVGGIAKVFAVDDDVPDEKLMGYAEGQDVGVSKCISLILSLKCDPLFSNDVSLRCVSPLTT